MGSSSLNWRHANRPTNTRPTIIIPAHSTTLSDEANEDSPYSSGTRPTVERITDSRSIDVRGKPSWLMSVRCANTMTITDAATTTPNSARHPTTSTSRPPAVGPMAGAKAITKPTRPMAAPRLSRGNVSRISDITITIMTPVDIACITRPIKSTANAGAIAATKLPAANSVMHPRNRRRVEKRPMNHAASGITTASVSAYAEVSHCTVVSSTLICCMIDGSAGESSVWFKTTSTAPASSTITMRFCSFVIPKDPIRPRFLQQNAPLPCMRGVSAL